MARLERYVQRGHRRVGGWLLDGAVQMIDVIGREQRRRAIVGPIVEIGVYKGRLFILLYLLTSDKENGVAIDVFDEQDGYGHGNRQKFIANLERFADTARVVIHQGDSTKLTAQNIVDFSFGRSRLFSIDGGHTAEITENDLALAEASISDDGVIILDDCFNEMWPEVSEGTYRYFSKPRGIIPFAIGGNKTLFCKPNTADAYAKALIARLPRHVTRSFMGRNVPCFDFSPQAWTQRVGQMNAWKAIKNVPPIRLARSLLFSK